MERSENRAEAASYRHPIYAAADQLKAALILTGFSILDDAESPEIERRDTSYPTWEEPKSAFGWLNDPLGLEDGWCFRTRLLPATLATSLPAAADIAGASRPIRAACFGRVYDKRDAQIPFRTVIEGIAASNGMVTEQWRACWEHIARVLFGLDACAWFEPAGRTSFEIIVAKHRGKSAYRLGYTGHASQQVRSALALADAEDAWTFVLDVERFACDCFDIADRSELYRNDLAFLRRFENAHPAVGTAPTFQVVDVLRALGYLETCGDVLYPAGIYRKMNMIQEKYDTNNAGIALAKPLGDAVSVRTVLVPAIEKTLAENYRAGIAETRLFEVGRCYLPPEGQDAPREFFTVAMAAYGEDVTADSFAADVQTVLRSLGAASVMCFPNNDAIAYQKDTCRLVIDLGGHYLDSNFGQISEVATKNFGIGVPAFMAQLELRSLVEGKSTGRWSDTERERRNRAAQ